MSLQHIPPDMTFNPDATPPQYSNGQADVIEKGSAVRLQIIGMRSDVGAIYAIGKMSGGWFGCVYRVIVSLFLFVSLAQPLIILSTDLNEFR